MNAGDSALRSWNDTTTKRGILGFVESATCDGGPDYVRPEERVAVFDNDGTLWCEKPMPIELMFILKRLAAMAEADQSLRGRQPWKAAYEKDYAWLGTAVTNHYHGDDTGAKVLIGGILHAFADMTVDAYQAAAAGFLRNGQHPTLRRRFRDCGYHPMVELLRYLEGHGFTNYIASGGDRDFMRTVTQEMYGIPPERVVGSSTALRYREDEHGGSILYEAEMEVFDDGLAKPVRIWSRAGRRPILAAGNSNGDVPMLEFAYGHARRALCLLVLHDDKQREFDYSAGAEKAQGRAKRGEWTVVSMKDDWATVFADERD